MARYRRRVTVTRSGGRRTVSRGRPKSPKANAKANGRRSVTVIERLVLWALVPNDKVVQGRRKFRWDRVPSNTVTRRTLPKKRSR